MTQNETVPNESEDQSNRLADRLIEADRSANDSAKGIDPMFERLLTDERRFEERVRRIAILSWALAVGCLFLLAGVVAFLDNVRISPRVELTDLALLLLLPIGGVAVLSGITTSLTWLFRSRTPTLRAIAYRLEALERRLAAER